ncbi:hypothetical protein C8J27_107155 [Rhodobacter aestuarii]|uniref:DNA repair protein n=1 Tax=Rhodobacter aestuarii TaxID=453582 RepID=A0A1N7NQ78_9RHOB|nr:DNA repair protein [Rhodobacter aestuarii]PTV94624.1 hypothetical protein C8J27_107155 [Rhodobacter aestuarii]SIT00442.1 hypothetical protein SAMN05421580_10872 [Rhodobacter aestuarii]
MSNLTARREAQARLNDMLQNLLSGAVFVFAFGALLLFGASATGLAPWLMLDLRFGDTPLPNAGIWIEAGVASLGFVLLLYLPAQRRVMAIERSHRNFRIGTEDVASAYRAIHAADRKGVFALSGEFDAMRERMEWLRKHPDLGHLEPELLELAAQMSLQSRDLAQVYSDEKVARARDFLRARQHEVNTARDRLTIARSICDDLRSWLTDVEAEERKLSEEFKLLERDLKAVLPGLGYELEEGPTPDNVVALPKTQK